MSPTPPVLLLYVYRRYTVFTKGPRRLSSPVDVSRPAPCSDNEVVEVRRTAPTRGSAPRLSTGDGGGGIVGDSSPRPCESYRKFCSQLPFLS